MSAVLTGGAAAAFAVARGWDMAPIAIAAMTGAIGALAWCARSGPGVEPMDRIGHAVTVVWLVALMSLAAERWMVEPFGRSGVVRPVAWIVPVALVLALARWLLGFGGRELRLSTRPRPTWTVVVSSVAALGLALTARAPAGAPPPHLLGIGVEEILFRGFVLAAVRERAGGTTAIVVSSLAFGLSVPLDGSPAHPDLVDLGRRTAIGACAGYATVVGRHVGFGVLSRIAGVALAARLPG